MRRPGAVIALACAGGVAGGLVALVGGLLQAWHCSSGDGGTPFVAPGSPQADLCAATADGIVLIVLGVGIAAGLAVAAVRVGRGWITGARPLAAYLCLVAAAVAAPLLLLWLVNLPSDALQP